MKRGNNPPFTYQQGAPFMCFKCCHGSAGGGFLRIRARAIHKAPSFGKCKVWKLSAAYWFKRPNIIRFNEESSNSWPGIFRGLGSWTSFTKWVSASSPIWQQTLKAPLYIQKSRTHTSLWHFIKQLASTFRFAHLQYKSENWSAKTDRA